MSQNVNLFNPALRKEQQAVTFKALVGCLAVALVALVGYAVYLQQDVKGLAEELRSAEALLKVQKGYADKLQGEAAARKVSTALEAEAARLEAELKQARESMDALKSGVLGSQEGFAEYLRAFSRQSMSGLWLTGLAISGGGEVEIRGRVVSPDLVPAYIQRLNREKALAGRSFARLEVAQPKADPEKGKDKGQDGRRIAAPPRFLDFSLATSEVSRTEKPQ